MQYLMLICGEESALAERGIEDGVSEPDPESGCLGGRNVRSTRSQARRRKPTALDQHRDNGADA